MAILLVSKCCDEQLLLILVFLIFFVPLKQPRLTMLQSLRVLHKQFVSDCQALKDKFV
jgi:hypothetical protein